MTVLVLIVACVAAVSDVRTYRIPNWLTFGTIPLALLLNVHTAGLSGLLLACGGFIIGGLALLPFYLAGGMGAGDVKLLAAFGALGGPIFAINALLVGSLLGGLAAAMILLRKYGLNEFFLRLYLALKIKNSQNDFVLPYGLFLAAGALLSCYGGIF